MSLVVSRGWCFVVTQPPHTARAVQGARPGRSLGLRSRKKLKGQCPTPLARRADEFSPADCQPRMFLELLGNTPAQISCQHTARPPLGQGAAAHRAPMGPNCCPQAPALPPSTGQGSATGHHLVSEDRPWPHGSIPRLTLCSVSVGTMQVTLPETQHQISR